MTISELIERLEAVRDERGEGEIMVYEETSGGRNHYREPMLGGHWESKVWQVTL